MVRRTRIVATIGPASESDAKLKELVQAGVDVFRLSFAHG
ncbi:MAG: pyruvate kinase, partial [Acidimicrobiales bacterium]